MSAEWVTAGSALATLFVIAITAYAAVRQIRHMRSGNQVAALLPLTEKYQTAEMQESLQYVISGALRRDLESEEVRRGVQTIPTVGAGRKALAILNFYESVGALVSAKVLDLDIVMRYFMLPSDVWEIANDYIAISRRSRTDEVYEPHHLPRLGVRDTYAEADAAWANT